MGERSMKKNAGHVKAVICRPSIIIGCYNEPYPGWTDVITAGGGMFLSLNLGVIHYVNCHPKTKIDLIPADYVSNLIIAAAVFTAIKPPSNGVTVVHSASSDVNAC